VLELSSADEAQESGACEARGILAMYVIACVAVFALAYLLNIFVISIGYHRGLAHRALEMHPLLRTFVVRGGHWITQVDPAAWVVMHRLHHALSDTERDPHSPLYTGLFGITRAQYCSYNRVLAGLREGDPELTRFVKDLSLPRNPLTRGWLWLCPYALHLIVFVVSGIAFGWLFGVAYLMGILSHPLQGSIVNGVGHAIGSRNFETPDNSRNNHLVAWLVLGEGYQNNHHRYPASAKFSYRRSEVDVGYGIALVAEKLGLLTIERARLIPAATAKP
jgi:fatty-acid desaturase